LSQVEVGTEKSPHCGYGLIGLCCAGCLLGPCRVNPFEKGSADLSCGHDTDWIVAENLLRLIAVEAIEEAGRLRESLLRLKMWRSAQYRRGERIGRQRKKLAEKYGFSSKRSIARIISTFLTEEMNLLCSFSKEPISVLSLLLPEKAFPLLHQCYATSATLGGLWVDCPIKSSQRSPELEALLHQSFRVSLAVLLSQELREDIHALINEREGTPDGKGVFPILEDLPNTPKPFVMALSEGDSFSHRDVSRDGFDELVRKLEGVAPVIRLKTSASLSEIGREVFRKWSLPITEVTAIVLISTPLAATVFGALALGFCVMSFPPLPIYGSEKVEMFFHKGLKPWFGSAYLISWEGDLVSRIQDFLE
jgi:hypothetical protein